MEYLIRKGLKSHYVFVPQLEKLETYRQKLKKLRTYRQKEKKLGVLRQRKIEFNQYLAL